MKKEWQKGLIRLIWLLVRFGLAAGIIVYLIRLHYGTFVKSLENFNTVWLIPAVALMFLQMTLSAYRWYLLVRVMRIELSLFESLSLTMKAYFFSLVIPGGAVGGDVAKLGFLAARVEKGSRFEGALTVLMDRLVGMAALFLLAIGIILAALPLLLRVEIPHVPIPMELRYLVIVGLLACCVAGILATMVFFFHRQLEKIRWIALISNKLDQLSHGKISRLKDTFDAYWSNWKLLLWCTGGSVIFIHLAQVPVVLCLMKGLGMTEFDLLTVSTAVVLGNIAGLLPLTPSGIGLRDATMCAILAAGGFTQVVAIPVLLTAVLIFCNLAGVLFFLFDVKGKDHAGSAT